MFFIVVKIFLIFKFLFCNSTLAFSFETYEIFRTKQYNLCLIFKTLPVLCQFQIKSAVENKLSSKSLHQLLEEIHSCWVAALSRNIINIANSFSCKRFPLFAMQFKIVEDMVNVCDEIRQDLAYKGKSILHIEYNLKPPLPQVIKVQIVMLRRHNTIHLSHQGSRNFNLVHGLTLNAKSAQLPYKSTSLRRCADNLMRSLR